MWSLPSVISVSAEAKHHSQVVGGHLLTLLSSTFSQIKIMVNKTWSIALTWLHWSLVLAGWLGWCFAHVRMLQLIFLKYILKFIHKLQRHFYYPNIRILLPTHRLFIIFEGKLWTHSILIKRSLSCRVVNGTSRNCTVPRNLEIYQDAMLTRRLAIVSRCKIRTLVCKGKDHNQHKV